MTPRIDIDDAVFTHLQSKAVAFVETPNDTLRRLLGIDVVVKSTSNTTRLVGGGKMERKPKASLGKMIQAGLLKNGQKLVLHDYQGRQVPNAVAYVGGDGIFANLDRKRLYSMSDLAQELLKKQGYQSDSVRGPAHWYAEDGRSVSEIWESHLGQTSANR
jgi:hypothetical protein